ncbi:hypothetical protein T492DRAFT_835986 [Pavlovales sp. CCMP2436]|nr:hypothetical protein T492DRAFT_835986 [Pavlovales sp. CCMP2436]
MRSLACLGGVKGVGKGGEGGEGGWGGEGMCQQKQPTRDKAASNNNNKILVFKRLKHVPIASRYTHSAQTAHWSKRPHTHTHTYTHTNAPIASRCASVAAAPRYPLGGRSEGESGDGAGTSEFKSAADPEVSRYAGSRGGWAVTEAEGFVLEPMHHDEYKVFRWNKI